MTYSEAILLIKQHNEIYSKKEQPFAVHITDALDMSIKALEKQIPWEVINRPTYTYGDISYTAVCPSCGQNLGWESEHLYKFCFNCGQAIKF